MKKKKIMDWMNNKKNYLNISHEDKVIKVIRVEDLKKFIDSQQEYLGVI